MKIAITADLHLRTKKEYPERYSALENVLDQCINLEITQLIIAGDLFDKDQSSFTDFEKTCQNKKYKKINIIVIPGNHDSKLSRKKIALDNVEILDKNTVRKMSDRWDFMFVPYQEDRMMGEVIQSQYSKVKNKKLAVVGHGDFIISTRENSAHESGIYMPLTRKDIETIRPDRVFLGHIHKAMERGVVSYPGSPSGLDITETGYRTFIIFDTEENEVARKRIDTETIYLQTNTIVFPTEDSGELLQKQIKEDIKSWNINSSDLKKTKLRVNVQGYSSDKKALKKLLLNEFSSFELEQDIDLSKVSFTDDEERGFLLEKSLAETTSILNELNAIDRKEKVYISLLNQIYGG